MKKVLLLVTLSISYLNLIQAQINTKDSTLQISGSADVYYKYDFSESGKNFSPYSTDYAMGTKENTIDFGLLNLKINKQINKASISADLAFGPRANDSKINNAISAFYIQNIIFSYQVKKELAISAGVMYRYETYEKLTSVDNFHYLMSNAYTEQRKIPARSVGIKAKYDFNDIISLTAGLYNAVDVASSPSDFVVSSPSYGLSDFSGQLVVKPIKNLELSAAIWKEGQKTKGTHLNFQGHYLMDSGLKLGLDITNYAGSDTAVQIANGYNNFTSAALYVQKPLSKLLTLGIRLEHELINQNSVSYTSTSITNTGAFTKENYNIATLTACEKLGALSFKQEIKYDLTDNSNIYSPYLTKNPEVVGGVQHGVTNKGVQAVLAAVYSF